MRAMQSRYTSKHMELNLKQMKKLVLRQLKNLPYDTTFVVQQCYTKCRHQHTHTHMHMHTQNALENNLYHYHRKSATHLQGYQEKEDQVQTFHLHVDVLLFIYFASTSYVSTSFCLKHITHYFAMLVKVQMTKENV